MLQAAYLKNMTSFLKRCVLLHTHAHKALYNKVGFELWYEIEVRTKEIVVKKISTYF